MHEKRDSWRELHVEKSWVTYSSWLSVAQHTQWTRLQTRTTKMERVSRTMNISSPIQSVIHATDFSLASEVAFVYALKIALAAIAELSVIHYAEQGVVTSWDYFPKVKEILVKWGMLTQDCSSSDLTALGLHVKRIGYHRSRFFWFDYSTPESTESRSHDPCHSPDRGIE